MDGHAWTWGLDRRDYGGDKKGTGRTMGHCVWLLVCGMWWIQCWWHYCAQADDMGEVMQ